MIKTYFKREKHFHTLEELIIIYNLINALASFLIINVQNFASILV